MTLNQLIYFEKVAVLENFHQASEQLFVSQPSLSRSIAALENELGVTLFKKSGRGVVLTKAGRLFLEYVTTIITDCDIASKKMKELSGNGGKIDIGYVFPLAGHYIPHKVRKFLNEENNDHIVFNFWQNHTPAIIQKILSGELDVGFGGWPYRDDLDVFPLLTQDMVIVTPKEHELGHIGNLPISVLGQYPVIGYDKNSWMGNHQKTFYHKYNINPNIVVECPDEYSILALVKEDFGIALVPHSDNLDNNPSIIVHPISDFILRHQVFMFWKKDAYHLPAVERFISYMKKQVEAPIDSPDVSVVYLKDIVNY